MVAALLRLFTWHGLLLHHAMLLEPHIKIALKSFAVGSQIVMFLQDHVEDPGLPVGSDIGSLSNYLRLAATVLAARKRVLVRYPIPPGPSCGYLLDPRSQLCAPDNESLTF